MTSDELIVKIGIKFNAYHSNKILTQHGQSRLAVAGL